MIYGVYIVSKSGGLIFNLDHNIPKVETEKVFNYPIDLMLDFTDPKKVFVTFGQKDGINGKNPTLLPQLIILIHISVGHVLTAINGQQVSGNLTEDGVSIKEFLDTETNFPVTLRFSRPKMTTNEKIFLASMFYPLFAIASQLSPEPKSSGIEVLEADTFKMHCFQTLTGVKFMVVADNLQSGLDLLLRKIYELYSDYVLKNPFYSLEMPIRCELFDKNLQSLLESLEKTGVVNL